MAKLEFETSDINIKTEKYLNIKHKDGKWVIDDKFQDVIVETRYIICPICNSEIKLIR
jgi:hypothetical protein